MKRRWAPGFTIVELIIVITVIGILATISILGYGGVQKTAVDKAMKSDLETVAAEMQRAALQNGGVFPLTLPSEIQASPDVALTLQQSGTVKFYGASGALTAVQNGSLMAEICQDLIDEGVGSGVNLSGNTVAYITSCGNWNDDSMQITGWDTEKFDTPVTDTALLAYANAFTTNSTTNKIQETVVRDFYHALVERHTRQGGTYPITSFWDYWATPLNGGVMAQPLPAAQLQPWYCVEATSTKYPDLLWHITDELAIEQGAC